MSELQSPHPISAQVGPDALDNQTELENAEIIQSVLDRGITINDAEAVTRSLGYIRNELGVPDDSFKNFGNRLILVSLATRLSLIDAEDDTLQGEIGYLSDLAMAVTEFPTETSKLAISDQRKKEVLDEYSQPDLTRDLHDYLSGPDFNDLRRRLGVVEETPYQVRVLTIADDDVLYGLVPMVDWTEEDKSYDEILAEANIREEYQTKLKKRTQRFNQDLMRDKTFAPAWVSYFEDGSVYLCVTSALAEKVMYREEERAALYTESSYEDDLAMLKHEYTHTQGQITNGPKLGIALEELRAEHFSGNRLGYSDIKRFFFGIRIITGYDVEASLELDGKPYDREEFFSEVARNIGLQGFLDVMTAMPQTYVKDEDVPLFTKYIAEYNGGLSGILERIHKREIERVGHEAVDLRLSQSVDMAKDRLKDNETVTVDSYFAHGGIDYLHNIAMENFRRRYPSG